MLTPQDRYYKKIRNDPTRWDNRKSKNRDYYSNIVKSDPAKLARHRASSREYARQRRLKLYLSKKHIEIMYLLFASNNPKGGANDLHSTHKTLDKAKSATDSLSVKWWHIYGIVEGKIVEES